MAEFTCARCGSTTAMEKAPVPGKLGQRILQHTCQTCWEAWDEAQVMLINEHRLNLAVQQHYEVLMTEMTSFLQLPAE